MFEWYDMNELQKFREASSVLESELEILMHELTPSDWAGLSICVDKLNAYLDELEAEYSDD